MQTENTPLPTIQDIKKEQENKHTVLFNACGLFWAFSNEQFAANKTPLKEGEKYVHIGAGGYLPKGNLDTFLDGMAEIKKWYKAQVNTNKATRRAQIAYELANYESYYTGDITDALQGLGKDYSAKEVWKVYHEENKKNQEAGVYN